MAAGGAAAAAAVMQAINASGVIVRLEPGEFRGLLRRLKDPLVVIAQAGVFSKTYVYLLSYKGLAFHTRSPEPIELPPGAEVVAAKRIWVPG